ncbi:MAG: atpF [Fibrobacteria bacterium]|jgi:F-type H+-transporting ATPase subunit b|nr:atpF [Fibrobacteria bacterium]
MKRSIYGAIASLTVLASVAQAASEAGHAALPTEEGSPLLRFDPGVGIWALVVFALLLLLLKKYAWTPILEALDAREKSVRESLEQAARIQSENARLAQEQAKLLAESRAQANQILQNAREAGEALKKSLETAAQEEKQRILASATTEIEAQKRAAVAELRKTTAELSIGIAEKLIRQNLDEAKSRALVDQLIQEVSPKAGA